MRVSLYLSAIFVVFLSPFGCQQANVYQPPPPPPVKVTSPVQQDVVVYVEETGTLEAVDKVELRARVRGFLEKINFEPGSQVKTGDLLFVIEKRKYVAKVKESEAQLAANKARLARAENELKRQRELEQKRATTQREIDAAVAAVEGSIAAIDGTEAELDEAKLFLEYTDVISPIDGIVGKALVKKGNLVDEAGATHLADVVKYDPIYANFDINTRDLLQIMKRYGSKDHEENKKNIRFFLAREDEKNFTYQGNFDYAAPEINRETGTRSVRAIFPNSGRELIPGMFVRIRIPIDKLDKAILIPERAVISNQNESYVLVVVQGDGKQQAAGAIAQRRNVVLGPKQGQLVVVLEGLTLQDQVIVEGTMRARPDSPVSPEKVSLSSLLTPAAGTETNDSNSSDEKGSSPGEAKPETAGSTETPAPAATQNP